MLELDYVLPLEANEWITIVGAAAAKLDIERPVVLNKHIRDLDEFLHTNFDASDFMDKIHFNRFGIEVFPEKKE